MYVLPTTNNKYVPIQKITTTIDLDQSKWKKYINVIENALKHRHYVDFSAYDSLRYLKMNRAYHKYDSESPFYENVFYTFKIHGFKLSDHKPLIKNGIFTWNLLHHYSYNGSNDYIDSNIIKHFNCAVLTERARYSLISLHIYESITKGECICYSLQECEYSIYQSLVKRLDKSSFMCRFIPQRIAYDNTGLYIESYGCAIIIKHNENTNHHKIYVNPVQKINHYKRESNYKYVLAIVNNVMYSSIHFPKCGKDNYLSWVNYVYQDLDIILSKLTNSVKEGYIIGDLNMKQSTLTKFLNAFSEYSFTILDNQGVDYVIHVTKNIYTNVFRKNVC